MMAVPELLSSRTLRAPNVWAPVPVMAVLLRSDRAAAEALARETLQLQLACGSTVSVSRIVEADEPGTHLLVIEFEVEELVEHCLGAALGSLRTGAGQVSAGGAELERLRALAGQILPGPNSRALAESAKRLGIPVRRLGHGGLIILGFGRKQRRLWGARSGRTSAIGEMIGWEKPLAKDLLGRVGVPVPRGRVVASVADALTAAAEIGKPVVIKPASANHGRSVFIGLTDPNEIRSAFEAASLEGETGSVIVEECIEGAEHRLLIAGGRLVAALRGDPLYIVGDGLRTVRELVDVANLDPARGDDPDSPLYPVRLDAIALATLRRQGYSPEAVPADGARVLIQRNGNMNRDVTADVHPENEALCALAAEVVGLDIAGVDLIAEDIARPIRDQGGAILEVNPMPGFTMHSSQPAAERIVRQLYSGGVDARIPIVAVYGGSRAASVASLLAGRIREEGFLTGLACGCGTLVDGRLTITGDCATTSAAADLLLHPRIEAAVIETSERAILAEGLPFDLCDLLVVADAPGGSLPRACRIMLDSAARVLMPESARWAGEAAATRCEGIVRYPEAGDDRSIVESAMALLPALSRSQNSG